MNRQEKIASEEGTFLKLTPNFDNLRTKQITQLEAAAEHADGRKDDFSKVMDEMQQKHVRMAEELQKMRADGKDKLSKEKALNAKLSDELSANHEQIVQLEEELNNLRDAKGLADR